mgnify:CR=1 FL=1
MQIGSVYGPLPTNSCSNWQPVTEYKPLYSNRITSEGIMRKIDPKVFGLKNRDPLLIVDQYKSMVQDRRASRIVNY